MTAAALAGELGLPLFAIQLDGLITKYMGETVAKLRLVFDAIQGTCGVYLFDEFDALGQRGDAKDVGDIRRAQTTPKEKGERRHEEMLDPVATLRLATLRGLWTDAPHAYPSGDVFVDMSPDEQADWAKELLARLTSPGGDAPAACVLDTGVNRGHPLLEVAMAAEDCTAVDPTWGHHDDGGPHMRWPPAARASSSEFRSDHRED